MFSIAERTDLLDRLVEAARGDDRIIAAAIVGSGARDAQDAWSDIDLALRVGEGTDPDHIVEAWTARMYHEARAVDHLDVWSGVTRYRVFLLASSLQVDISFWAAETFAATGGPFRLLFGEANPPRAPGSPRADDPVGMGWLYALHARSSIARGRALQALHMINGVRDQAIALACASHGLASHQGRGVDDLPADLRSSIAQTLVRGLDEAELRRSFAASVGVLLDVAARADSVRVQRIREVARELSGEAPRGSP